MHWQASSEWSLPLGCSEIIPCVLQNSYVQDTKIYRAKWHLLQHHGCSGCHHHSPVVNDVVVWQGKSKNCFFSSANRKKKYASLFSCGSKDAWLWTCLENIKNYCWMSRNNFHVWIPSRTRDWQRGLGQGKPCCVPDETAHVVWVTESFDFVICKPESLPRVKTISVNSRKCVADL